MTPWFSPAVLHPRLWLSAIPSAIQSNQHSLLFVTPTQLWQGRRGSRRAAAPVWRQAGAPECGLLPVHGAIKNYQRLSTMLQTIRRPASLLLRPALRSLSCCASVETGSEGLEAPRPGTVTEYDAHVLIELPRAAGGGGGALPPGAAWPELVERCGMGFAQPSSAMHSIAEGCSVSPCCRRGRSQHLPHCSIPPPCREPAVVAAFAAVAQYRAQIGGVVKVTAFEGLAEGQQQASGPPPGSCNLLAFPAGGSALGRIDKASGLQQQLHCTAAACCR